MTSAGDKAASSIHRKATTFFAILFPVIVFGLPLFLSEAIGGWTKKYTSPVNFTPSNIPDLAGKVAIVTGANTGIGYHTALELARNGAEVIVAARSVAKGEAAVSKMKQEITNIAPKLHFLQLDLSSLESVETFASNFIALKKSLHILVLNAGVMKSPGGDFIGRELTYGFETTRDGFEYHIGVNHVGHFYLTQLLTTELKNSAPSRVISVSSSAEMNAYEEGMRFEEWIPTNGEIPHAYEDGKAYGQSKLANALFVRELASIYNGTGVSAYSLHPGVIETELFRHMDSHFMEEAKTNGFLSVLANRVMGGWFSLALFAAKDGALTQLHLATAAEDSLVNGGFYHPIGNFVHLTHSQGANETLQKMLWDETERAIKFVRQ